MFLTLIHTLIDFVIPIFIEQKALTLGEVFVKVSLIISVLNLNTMFAALIQYITSLHGRMKQSNFENIKHNMKSQLDG